MDNDVTVLGALRAGVERSVTALNSYVSGLYPIGTKVTVQHAGAPMHGTVIRHAVGCYHAGELLVRAKSWNQQWVAVDRILSVEAP